MTDAFIWRDANDPDQFYLGIALGPGGTSKRMWAAVFTDGLSDLFDIEIEDLKAIGTTPVPINLEMVLPPHESLVPRDEEKT